MPKNDGRKLPSIDEKKEFPDFESAKVSADPKEITDIARSYLASFSKKTIDRPIARKADEECVVEML